MLFNSLTFLLFFIIVLVLYYIFPHKLRWILLLIASYIFYMAWRAELIILILFTTFTNYIISLKIYNSIEKNTRKKLLILSIIINFGLLFIFKYLMFFSNSLQSIYNFFGFVYPIKEFDIILPMGISFYTFQAASYTIDIYKNRYKPEKNFFKFSLFITFFPQLVAGPIERADRLLSQLFTKKEYNLENIIYGTKIIIIGYFKKVVIADRIAIIVNTVYNSPNDFEGISFIIATILFTIQIYCDFSGYSDIAIGCAKMLDINLIKNFDRPYFSKNIKEFWKRWHISLSTWFRDYLYIPLGGNRVSTSRRYLNLLITFMASGLWHGANWTFVIWGTLHGLYQIIGDIKNKIFKNIKTDFFIFNVVKILITFILVAFAWIFFRANTINDAYYIITNLFTGINNWTNIQYLYDVITSLGLSLFEIEIAVFTILLLVFIEIIEYKKSIHKILMKAPFIIRFIFYYFIVLIIFTLGVYNNAGEFIYFQF